MRLLFSKKHYPVFWRVSWNRENASWRPPKYDNISAQGFLITHAQEIWYVHNIIATLCILYYIEEMFCSTYISDASDEIAWSLLLLHSFLRFVP